MTAYASPNFDTLLNAENSASTFIGYFDTDTDNAGIGSTGSQPPSNLPGSNAQGKVQPPAEIYAAQSQQRPQEQQETLEVSMEGRVKILENDVTILKNDVVYLKDNMATKEDLNQAVIALKENTVTKEYLTQTVNALKKDMVTKDDMRELLNKKVEEQVIDGKSPYQSFDHHPSPQKHQKVLH
jgi:hypothetical protein